MKRFILLALSVMLVFLSFVACEMESTIPENADTFSIYRENRNLFESVIKYMSALNADVLVSRQDYFPIEGGEDYSGLYLKNMTDGSHIACEEQVLVDLFENSDVKMVDAILRDELFICSFDLCIPGKNFDYGIYYCSADAPIYFGDPTIDLSPSGNGFIYEKKASYGVKFTYYTEKIDDHFYYYELQ